jgi:hypothetical protein
MKLVTRIVFLGYLLWHLCAGMQVQRTCRVCKQKYDQNTNNIRACRYHTGRWLGAELSKHYGTKLASEVPKSEGHTSGLALFWDCCDAETYESEGCKFGFHKSYDEEENDAFMLNKRI